MGKVSAEYQRQWRKNNPEKSRAHTKAYRENNPDKMLKWARTSRFRKFPPTRPEPLRCEACGQPPTGKKNRRVLCVDHDHEAGEFRGWLCHNCNTALGLLKDSVQRIRLLGVYLEKYGSWLTT